MLITTSVSGPPQHASRTAATSSAVASPTENGRSAKSSSTLCRNGSCTSRLCSWACARSSTRTPDSPRASIAPTGVDRHDAEGRPERVDAGDGEATYVHAVARPEEDDPADRRSCRDDPCVRARRDRTRVHVPGVGHDECLGDDGIGGRDHGVGERLAERRAKCVRAHPDRTTRRRPAGVRGEPCGLDTAVMTILPSIRCGAARPVGAVGPSARRGLRTHREWRCRRPCSGRCRRVGTRRARTRRAG